MAGQLSIHVNENIDPTLMIGNNRATLIILNSILIPVITKVLLVVHILVLGVYEEAADYAQIYLGANCAAPS